MLAFQGRRAAGLGPVSTWLHLVRFYEFIGGLAREHDPARNLHKPKPAGILFRAHRARCHSEQLRHLIGSQ
jgi:hypothetical protein